MVRDAVVSEEVGVARGDDPFAGEQPRVAMIGVEPVPAPRVVAEHDLRAKRADPPSHLGPLLEP
jgi:hypothetical protein